MKTEQDAGLNGVRVNDVGWSLEYEGNFLCMNAIILAWNITSKQIIHDGFPRHHSLECSSDLT